MERIGGQGNQAEANERTFNFEKDTPFDPSLIAPLQGGYEAAHEEGDEQTDPVAEAERLRQELAQYQADAAQAKSRADELEQLQARRDAEESRKQFEQWQNEYQNALAQAEQMPHKDAVRFLADLMQRREQSLLGWGQTYFNENLTLKWTKQAEKIAKDEGLSESDVEDLLKAATLAGDPKAMKEEAKRIKSRSEQTNSEFLKMKEEFERMKAELNRDRLASSPVNRVGGSSGNRGSAPSNVVQGSRAHLEQLLQGVPR